MKRFANRAPYAGVREALEVPPRVHFKGRDFQTTFAFESRDALYALLHDPLEASGWTTLDGC